MTNARFALEAIEKKKKEKMATEDKKRRKRRSKSRSRSRRRRSKSHRSRSSRSRSSRSHSRSSRSRRKHRRKRRRRSARSSSSRSRSRARRRTAIAGAFGGRRDKKVDMVWDGFNWFPKGSNEAKATKQAEAVSAGGPVVRPLNNFSGVALAQEALKSFNRSTNAFPPPGL